MAITSRCQRGNFGSIPYWGTSMNVSIAETAFRTLRKTWFDTKLRSYPHEREWEDDTRASLREENNENMRKLYDKQTEQILAGENKPIAPRCHNDMCEAND